MVSVLELREFVKREGGQVLPCRATASPRSDGDDLIKSFAHVEDAGPETISWSRREEPVGFLGRVILRAPPWKLHPSSDVILHSEIRSLVSKIGKRFFGSNLAPTVDLRSTVHRTAIVGAKPQNYEWLDECWQDFPSCGSVRIHKNVEVGAYATIVRGSVGDTTLAEGVRIGQHVNIGHDTRIGAHSIIIAHTSIAGWVRVGERVRIYQGALVKNGVQIGDGAVIGMGAVVTRDVGPGEVWAGNPAKKIG